MSEASFHLIHHKQDQIAVSAALPIACGLSYCRGCNDVLLFSKSCRLLR